MDINNKFLDNSRNTSFSSDSGEMEKQNGWVVRYQEVKMDSVSTEDDSIEASGDSIACPNTEMETLILDITSTENDDEDDGQRLFVDAKSEFEEPILGFNKTEVTDPLSCVRYTPAERFQCSTGNTVNFGAYDIRFVSCNLSKKSIIRQSLKKSLSINDLADIKTTEVLPTPLFNKSSNTDEENEKIETNAIKTNKRLLEMGLQIASYNGPNSTKTFINLLGQLNSIKEEYTTLLSNTLNNTMFNSSIPLLINYTDVLVDNLNGRAADYEDQRANELISIIHREVIIIAKEIGSNSPSIDELNVIEKKLQNFVLSLDSVSSKERPAVNENYVNTVRKVNGTLELLKRMCQKHEEAATTSSLTESDNSLDLLLQDKLNANEKIFNHFECLLMEELDDGIALFNDIMKEAGGLDKYINNFDSVHKEAIEIGLASMNFTTKILQLANAHKYVLVTEGVKYAWFNRKEAKKSFIKQKNKGFEVISNEQENLLKFTDKTQGCDELPRGTLPGLTGNTNRPLNLPVDPYVHDDFNVGKNNGFGAIAIDVANRRADPSFDFLIEDYKCMAKKQKFGEVYNSKIKDLLEKLKLSSLEKFKKTIKDKIQQSTLMNKINEKLDVINESFLAENYKLWKIENERFESYLSETQLYYKNSMSEEILSLAYIPDPEQLEEFHHKVFPRSFNFLKTKCTNLEITLKEPDLRKRLEQMANNSLEKMRENISLKKFNQRKTAMAATNQFNYAVGIDLGTTFSCITVYKDGKFEEIKDYNDLRTIPSAVYTGTTRTIVGNEALIKGLTDPENLVLGVKRIIGRYIKEKEVQSFISTNPCNKVTKNNNSETVVCYSNGSKCKPEEISAKILKELKNIAEHQMKNPVNDAVVTIPAYFNEPQRRATLEACKIAGLNVLRLLNEPTAAALAYGFQYQCQERKTILVFDFGGGTCDVSILEVHNTEFNVKASYGDNYLGGLDLDQNLMNHLVANFESKNGLRVNDYNKRRISQECERVKKILSEKLRATACLADVSGVYLREAVERTKFEEINKDLFNKALNTVEKCLESAGLTKYDIDDVVLAGGSSHIPKMQQDLREYFGMKKLECKINPDEAISYGAALQAAILTGECKKEFTLSEITPLSLGVNVIHDRYSIIIPKNTEVPCKATERYTTVYDFQRSICAHVYQGEKLTASLNSPLGIFRLNNIARRKAGETEFDVTFKIDVNGILTVTAVEVGNENNQITIAIERNVT